MNNKDLLIAAIATLSLIASVIIPFASRKYDQWKAKASFDLYLKKYLGVVFNILTYDKIEYHQPSIKDNPEKQLLTLPDYIHHFQKDYKEHQNTLQPRIGFPILLNLQYLILTCVRINIAINQADVSKLYEQTLSYGHNLSKKELNKTYALLLMMEHFGSILSFHDRFDNMKVVKRSIKEQRWVGMQLDGNILGNQHLISEDLKHLCNEEASMIEIITILKLMTQEFKKYYQFDKLIASREK